MNGVNFIKFHYCLQKWYALWFDKTLFLIEHAFVYLLLVKILFANTTNNQIAHQTSVHLTFVYWESMPEKFSHLNP